MFWVKAVDIPEVKEQHCCVQELGGHLEKRPGKGQCRSPLGWWVPTLSAGPCTPHPGMLSWGFTKWCKFFWAGGENAHYSAETIFSSSGNAWYHESNIRYDGEMHLSCSQRRRTETTRGNIFPGRSHNIEAEKRLLCEQIKIFIAITYPSSSVILSILCGSISSFPDLLTIPCFFNKSSLSIVHLLWLLDWLFLGWHVTEMSNEKDLFHTGIREEKHTVVGWPCLDARHLPKPLSHSAPQMSRGEKI